MTAAPIESMQARVLMTQPVIDDIPVWFQRSRELGGRRSSDAILGRRTYSISPASSVNPAVPRNNTSPIQPPNDDGPLTLMEAYLQYRKRLDANQPQVSAFTNAPAAASPLPPEGPLILNDAYLEYRGRLDANRS